MLNARGIRLQTDYREGILPDAFTRPLTCKLMLRTATQPGTAMVRATLEAVIFEDGHFVGPDSGKDFGEMATQLIAEQELAALVSAARKAQANGRRLGPKSTGSSLAVDFSPRRIARNACWLPTY